MFGEPAKIDNIELAVTNFSPSSPKLRFSAFTYLLDAGALKHMDPDEFMELLENVVAFTVEDYSEFVAELEDLEEDEKPGPLVDLSQKRNDDEKGSPYL